MRTGKRVRGPIAGFLVLLLAATYGEASVYPQGISLESKLPKQQPEPVQNAAPQAPGNAAPAQPESAPAAQQQTTAAPRQPGDQEPAGTAAAPAGKSIGVAASRPAGAVIAPAKQRRSRAILIRVALVLGACVAVGTVVGLSKASPARPTSVASASR